MGSESRATIRNYEGTLDKLYIYNFHVNLTEKKIYFSKSDVAKAIAMIENDKTRSKQTTFLNLTLFVSEAVGYLSVASWSGAIATGKSDSEK